jgi:hypothetical protein
MAVFTAKNKKGAFQLSLGFIITVVFAVVLLSLGLVWLRGAITGITDLTEQLQQQAGVELDKVFQETTVNFAIWPPDGPVFEVGPGTRLAVVAGVRNDAGDGNQHTFGVYIEAPSGFGGTVQQIANKPIANGQNAKFPLIINVPEAHPDGEFIFRITSCSDYVDPGAGSCPESGIGAHLWGGSAKDFVLSIQS